jgi:hypothetical protein
MPLAKVALATVVPSGLSNQLQFIPVLQPRGVDRRVQLTVKYRIAQRVRIENASLDESIEAFLDTTGRCGTGLVIGKMTGRRSQNLFEFSFNRIQQSFARISPFYIYQIAVLTELGF